MKLIEVPIFNEDGSVQCLQVLSAEEVQVLLQFALNFLTSAGLTVRMLIDKNKEKEEPVKVGLND